MALVFIEKRLTLLFVKTPGCVRLDSFGINFSRRSFSMDGTVDELLVLAAKQVNGRQKRIFLAAVCEKHGGDRRAQF